MSYNLVGTPKFYIDAVLLARKLGHVTTENAQGKYYLNPTKTTNIEGDDSSNALISIFMDRLYCNAITHCFILGHQFDEDGISVQGNTISETGIQGQLFAIDAPDNNGFSKYEGANTGNLDANRFTINLSNVPEGGTPLGDISVGWSYTMPHSPDLELTQTFANESLRVQTTKGGHTLTSTGWTQPPKWGNYSQWKRSSQVAYPTRRSWNLKFSYLSDSDMMPQYYNEIDDNNHNRGIFERTHDGIQFDTFNIKDNFLSKVMPTINLGLFFIFQPNKDVEEYAICRVNANSVTMNQVAHSVYDVSLDIVEIW